MSNSIINREPTPAEPEYSRAFWNYVRKIDETSVLHLGAADSIGGYELPSSDSKKFLEARDKNSIFRKLATVYGATGGRKNIIAYEHDDVFEWIAENGAFPVEDIEDDFSVTSIGSYKLGTILKIHTNLAEDACFNLERYITNRLGKSCAKAEDDSFTNGDGENSPTGILDDTEGAETGVTTDSITCDDVIELFFSVKPEYRDNAVWMMNDKTAMALRKLKDENGFPIWNHNSDTIFGKPVIINNYMPDAEDGNKPIAFGDFSYYWIINRRRFCVRSLIEKYIQTQYLGVQAFEFLDAKLIRKDAIKVISISDNF